MYSGSVAAVNEGSRENRLFNSRSRISAPSEAMGFRLNRLFQALRLGGKRRAFFRLHGKQHQSVLPAVLLFGPEVRAGVLYGLPPVASLGTELQGKDGPNSAEHRSARPTEVATGARVGARRQDAARG